MWDHYRFLTQRYGELNPWKTHHFGELTPLCHNQQSDLLWVKYGEVEPIDIFIDRWMTGINQLYINYYATNGLIDYLIHNTNGLLTTMVYKLRPLTIINSYNKSKI